MIVRVCVCFFRCPYPLTLSAPPYPMHGCGRYCQLHPRTRSLELLRIFSTPSMLSCSRIRRESPKLLGCVRPDAKRMSSV
ncbi:uncharacterized protein BDV17DRAFT_269086 [Aspergillus undulatus]|uniref:uncharacterized protein n=1 Tax=Aspergillus undulatus TaxID=1810928 RepID=UPI003CCDD650